jgi:FkbM family methyltransferase
MNNKKHNLTPLRSLRAKAAKAGVTLFHEIVISPKRVKYGFETATDALYRIILVSWEIIRYPFRHSFKKRPHTIYTYYEFMSKYFLKYFDGKIFDFNGIKLPDFRNEKSIFKSFYPVYEDVFYIYLKYGDDYSSGLMHKINPCMNEGAYCYSGKDGADITIKKGDVVIDVGAWIGDFSAYASKKGAKVYAFEPEPSNLKWLKKTANLNKNIKVIALGLGNEEKRMGFASRSEGSSIDATSTQNLIKVTTLDKFVKENNITKLDFIKSDIEGFERNLLLGAKHVLKNLRPKLSICTYHYPDDPEVLAKIIKEANPSYKIIQVKKKLYAYVPK